MVLRKRWCSSIQNWCFWAMCVVFVWNSTMPSTDPSPSLRKKPISSLSIPLGSHLPSQESTFEHLLEQESKEHESKTFEEWASIHRCWQKWPWLAKQSGLRWKHRPEGSPFFISHRHRQSLLAFAISPRAPPFCG